MLESHTFFIVYAPQALEIGSTFQQKKQNENSGRNILFYRAFLDKEYYGDDFLSIIIITR